MPLTHGGPRYALLAQNLIGKIKQGVYPAGSLLPTEAELGRQFDVSRITVRAALKELETKGLITRRARIGTRVNAPRPASVFVQTGDTVEEMLLFTKGMPFRKTGSRSVIVNAELAAAMQLPEGQEFLELRGLRGPRHQPIAYSHHYIPALRAPLASALDGAVAAIADIVAEASNRHIATIRQQIEPARLKATEARLLNAKPQLTALRSRRWFYDQDGSLLVATLSIFPQGRYVYSSVLQRKTE
ncbi:GntR family transcriptional regulator [Candidimonas nitroreducens]|uniref:HTH gntR-type domain-containing protein n=1 Tax=Candidimonas nitroreducens TaxID=683354 RepID=A0A225MK24_9BURK|nr:GntR family transcriptional regulator [Candidimonas nitroreducens]OWT60280.1 hypothetical protein CEY11_11545 [Candidimonas nitroreducens]